MCGKLLILYRFLKREKSLNRQTIDLWLFYVVFVNLKNKLFLRICMTILMIITCCINNSQVFFLATLPFFSLLTYTIKVASL